MVRGYLCPTTDSDESPPRQAGPLALMCFPQRLDRTTNDMLTTPLPRDAVPIIPYTLLKDAISNDKSNTLQWTQENCK